MSKETTQADTHAPVTQAGMAERYPGGVSGTVAWLREQAHIAFQKKDDAQANHLMFSADALEYYFEIAPLPEQNLTGTDDSQNTLSSKRDDNHQTTGEALPGMASGASSHAQGSGSGHPSPNHQLRDDATITDFANRLFNLHGFMLCEEYRGKPAVTITFPNLKEAQQFHAALVELSQHKDRAALASEGRE